MRLMSGLKVLISDSAFSVNNRSDTIYFFEYQYSAPNNRVWCTERKDVKSTFGAPLFRYSSAPLFKNSGVLLF